MILDGLDTPGVPGMQRSVDRPLPGSFMATARWVAQADKGPGNSPEAPEAAIARVTRLV